MGLSLSLYRADHVLSHSDWYLHNHDMVNAIFIRFKYSEVCLEDLTIVPEQNIGIISHESEEIGDRTINVRSAHDGKKTEKLQSNISNTTLFTCHMCILYA